MASVENLEGKEIEGWRLSECLGRGADGIVYASKKGEKEAALKLFFADSLAKNGLSNARERLELQLALIGKKHHPNLVEIYEGGESRDLGTLYLVMEFIPGKSLDRIIGNIPPSEVVSLGIQLASVGEFLEREGLVHRDIKPANLIISDDLKHLTLLDLSIVHQLPTDDDRGRLSGSEFVATLRYSPPEFVWRTEEADVDGAWRAITFYQIGATLHDMIMGRPLFDGHDSPRARLYDAVRELTPQIESSLVPSSLIQTVQACLLKDWRQRLQFLSWESFSGVAQNDTQQQEARIRLRQLRTYEAGQAAARGAVKAPGKTRSQDLWHLNNALILEIRTYLMNAAMFPTCHVHEEQVSDREYFTRVEFDRDPMLGFANDVFFRLTVAIDPSHAQATKLSFTAEVGGVSAAQATWTEMFTVDAAFIACRKSFLDAIESMLGR